MLTPEENVLVAELGIYGCWLLRHAAYLKLTPATERLKDAYRKYRGQHIQAYLDGKSPYFEREAFELICLMDELIEVEGWPPLMPTYPAALEDLLEHRAAQSSAEDFERLLEGMQL